MLAQISTSTKGAHPTLLAIVKPTTQPTNQPNNQQLSITLSMTIQCWMMFSRLTGAPSFCMERRAYRWLTYLLTYFTYVLTSLCTYVLTYFTLYLLTCTYLLALLAYFTFKLYLLTCSLSYLITYSLASLTYLLTYSLLLFNYLLTYSFI